MQRLIIAAAALSLLAASAASAEDYPPCTHRGQDHCRVVTGHMGHGASRGHHHHHRGGHHHHHGRHHAHK